MRQSIGFFTTTRAEFGILSSFIKKVNADETFDTFLFVGGTHLKQEFGHTIDEINSFGFTITDTFDYLESGDSAYELTKSSGKCMIEVAKIFRKYPIDYICILGDRYELISIVLASVLFNVRIIHFGGGEITEGVIDNQIRHMITQASYIHLTAATPFSNKVVAMGMPSQYVCTVGSLVVELMKNKSSIDKKILFSELELNPDKDTILLTYHPTTLKSDFTQLEQIRNLFEALGHFDLQVVVTAPNLETERATIMKFINDQVEANDNIHFFSSLGVHRYHSMIPNCKFVIGNSSSGLFEVPYFRIPTINVGNRQKGRYLHESVIQVDNEVKSIIDGIQVAMSEEFKKSYASMEYIYGDGYASDIALDFLKRTLN